MSCRSNVAPSTLEVDLVEGGIVVRYLDGREVFYHGPPAAVEEAVTTPPGKDVHVLVTDPDGIEGVMTYVNDLKTDAGILESTGVGRIVLDRGERTELFPGVTVAAEGYSIRVAADPSVVDGRVFVFAEDEFDERAYELVDRTDAAVVDGANEAETNARIEPETNGGSEPETNGTEGTDAAGESEPNDPSDQPAEGP